MTSAGPFDLLSFFAEPCPGSPAAAINALLPGQEQLALMRASFLRHHRLRRQVVLTDHDTSIWGADPYRGRVRHGPTFMLDALRLQRDFLAEADFRCPIVFCDPDILFLASIAPAFTGSFDVAFTRRAHRRMPFNSGIFFLDNRDKAAVVAFWDQQVQIVEEMFLDHAEWYADQLVLGEIVANRSRESADGSLISGPTRLKLLDGAEYNYSPHRDHPYLFRVPRAAVYHFKGRCRTYMRPFFAYHVHHSRGWLARLPAFLRDCVAAELSHSRLKPLFEGAAARVSLR